MTVTGKVQKFVMREAMIRRTRGPGGRHRLDRRFRGD